ncbi:MAG: hypothetical protein ABI832_11535 [bacterium]
MMRAMLSLVASLAASQAMALQPKACEFETASGDDFAWAGPVTDMGQGMVMQAYGSRSVWSSDTEVKFTLCASGQTLASVSQTNTEQDSWSSPVNYFEVMRDAIASPQSFTLKDMESQIRAAGGNALFYSADTEACGCAAFYPNLRGTKTPWSSQ